MVSDGVCVVGGASSYLVNEIGDLVLAPLLAGGLLSLFLSANQERSE